MPHAPGCRVLAIMGSGETSPTMVTVHKDLVARLPPDHRRAVLLETPYAFQENVADVTARAQSYFARSVGLTVTASAAAPPAESDPGQDGGLSALYEADWVFAGPGSPSYALDRWRRGPAEHVLRERVRAGAGVTVLASAAAATTGFAALPVYEIYKAGVAPHWLEGLDLLGLLSLRVAVIPHYDNAEGRTHDTRYCYLGERRLQVLEQELPSDAAIFGVDEHTAAVFDLNAATMTVTGHGTVTVRRSGTSVVLPSGTVAPLAEVRDLVRRDRGDAPSWAASKADPGLEEHGAPAVLPDLVADAERRFTAAARCRDAAAMTQEILGLEAAIHDWDADTDEDQGTEQARAVLRGLITRLGRLAQEGAIDPASRFGPAVEPLLALRDTLRGQGQYPAADTIRDALAATGVDIQDTPAGTRWVPRPRSATPPS